MPNRSYLLRQPQALVRLTLALALLSGCAREPETTLDFKAQTEGQRLVVEGTTSLPDEAPLLIQLNKPPDMAPLLESTAIVKAGTFTAAMALPPTMAEGPYAVRVFFSPHARAWSPRVREVVGPEGEHLRGPLVRQDPEGYRVLERLEPVWIGPSGV